MYEPALDILAQVQFASSSAPLPLKSRPRRYGYQCFGERFRFQDIRDHPRFNGVLIVLAVAGA